VSHEDDKTRAAEDLEVTDEDAAAILERRGRFIRAAMATLAGASIVAACSGETTGEPGPTPPRGDAAPEATAQPCLSIAAYTGTLDTGTSDAKRDSAVDAGGDGPNDANPVDAADDGIPQPCLSPPPFDSGND
jgi:hypothetical protein